MRKLTRKQILARLFVGFFTLGSLLCAVNSAVAGGLRFGEYKIEHSGSEPKVASITSEICPVNKSYNTVTVNLYGPDTGNVQNIYGGYSDSDENTSGNSVIITTKKNIDVKLSNVYGGYTNNGNVLENKVDIASSTVNFFVYGGYVFDTGNAASNSVHIASSTIGDVYGGYIRNKGSATQNIVDIASSTVNGSVYSGFTYNGNVLENKVNIASSTVTGDVYGGYAHGTGNAVSNSVHIASSTVDSVCGVYAEEGNATSNSVYISNSTINDVVWGAYVISGFVASNSVAIASSTVKGEVLGGNVGTGNAASNSVAIAGSTVTGDVYGGIVTGSSNNSALENKVTIAGSTVGSVYGGYIQAGTGSATQNIVDIASSTVDNNVYGGYVSTGSATQNIVHIASSTISRSVYGVYVSSKGNAASNSVHIASSTISDNVYSGYTYNGNAASNSVHIASSTVKNNVYGGYTNNGNVLENKVNIASSTLSYPESSITNNFVYGGYTNNGDATQNIIDIASSTVKGVVYSGYTYNGNAASNSVHIASSTVGSVSGGYAEEGNAASNSVDIASSTISDNVYSGYTYNGNAASNSVHIASSTVGSVSGGYIRNIGSATQNIVKISSGNSTGYIYGGYTNNGNATGNEIEIGGADSSVGVIYGGCVFSNSDATGVGSATNNIVKILSGASAVSVHGGFVGGTGNGANGNAIGNTVEISDKSKVINGVYGGFTSNGNASKNTVKISGESTVECSGGSVYGGSVDSGGDGDATDNTVILSDSSKISQDIYCGYVSGNGNATNNTVEISGGSTVSGWVFGGLINKDGNATDNTVEISDSSFVGFVYGGKVNGTGNGDATNNTVEISGGSTVDKDVYGGFVGGTGDTNDAVTGNKLIIAGAGNTIGGKIENFETMTFDAADVKKDETMLSLTTESPFTIGVKSIETNNADLSVGEKITLISSAVDNLYDGSITYKIDGKQAIQDSNKFIANVVKEDSDKIVHINEYAYEYNSSDYKLNLCNNNGFITGLYNGFDAEGAKQTLGQAEMTISSVPQNVTKVYGAYSEYADVISGGATINLETTELSDVDLIGSYNLKDETKVDTSKNTLNVNVSGVKVKSVNGFDNLNFKLVLDENPMLYISDSFDLSKASINVNLANALAEGQTVTLLSAAQQLSLANDKLTINNEKLDSDLSLKIVDDSSKKYVNVGGYSLNNASGKLSITADESFITSKYINGDKSKSVEKLVLTSELSGFKEIYGSYSADNSVAEGGTISINEKVDMSQTTLIGGKATGNGTVGKNILEIASSAAGSKVKGINSFSDINFTLGSDIAAGTTMLPTVDKVALGGASVNTEMSGIALGKGEKIVLLDNADKGNAELKLNGKAGDQTVAEENSSFVAVSSLGYNTDDNKIAIECKDAFAAGCYIDENGQTMGNNTLTLGSSAASNMRAGYERASEAPDMSGYKDIYGIYSAGSANPTGATIEIVSAIDYSNSVLHGGYKVAERAFYAEGNTLRVKSLNSKVKGITDFETMEFDLPAETKNGDTMLKVTEAVDMEPTKTVAVEASKATGLKAGDSVNLIASDEGIKNFGTQKVTLSDLTDKTGEVKVDDKALVLALDKNGEKPNDNTKAPVEAISATMALVNQASALAFSKLNKSMTAAVASANGGSATFASMNGGHSKYETGSYVEADSWNIGFGLAKKGMSKKNPDTTYGLFFQYGKSSFDTHNDGGYRGDGDSKMFGAGLMFHQEARSKYYYHGNIYAGKVDADWSSKDGSYDDKATYYGMTFGMGRKHNAGGNKTMDIYGRYSFNHVGSMNGDLNGLKYDFDSISSHNLRLGLRMEYAKKNSATAYWGLAWEHEFAGASGATLTTPNIVERTASPSLKGDSGIAEVGYQWKRGNWEYNINAEGSFGKREGVTGSFNINYNF